MTTYNNFVNTNKYYLLHATTINNLASIIKSGYIKKVEQLDNYEEQFGSVRGRIFLSMQAEKLKNIKVSYDMVILLHPEIMFDRGVLFNKGWGYNCGFIKIKTSDTTKEKTKKLKKFVKYLEDPDLPPILKGWGLKEHEIEIKKQVDIKEHMVGIICNAPKETYDKIKKLLKLCGYDVPVFNTNVPPDYNELNITL